jgi:hypothetical protein
MLRWHENVNGAGGLWNTVVVGTIAGATDVIAVSLVSAQQTVMYYARYR